MTKSIFDLSEREFKTLLSQKTTPNEIMDNAGNIYAFLSVLFGARIMDSLIREWTFQWYCEQTTQSYDTIYLKWLKNN